MESTKKLQACHSCLSKARFIEFEGSFHVICSQCDEHYVGKTTEEAFLAWNSATGMQRLFMAAMHPGVLKISEIID